MTTRMTADTSPTQYAFLPGEVTVPAGTTITWANEDEAVHTVTAADQSWDSGRLPIGGTFSHTFAEPGTYAFSCTIHPAMKGVITVQEEDSATAG